MPNAEERFGEMGTESRLMHQLWSLGERCKLYSWVWAKLRLQHSLCILNRISSTENVSGDCKGRFIAR